MRTHDYIAVLVIAAALLLGGVLLAGGSAGDAGDSPSAAAVGTVGVGGQVTVWGVASRVGTLVLAVGAPIAFLYWLATVNVGSVDPPGRLDRERGASGRVEGGTYEPVRGKSN